MFESLFSSEMLLWLGALVVSITVHEFAHAWSASFLGDNTAKHSGRITLNPLAHLDPIGTLAIIFFHFGWGKPVPVNPNNFKNPKVGWALVSIAGPFSNLCLAFLLSIPLQFLSLDGIANDIIAVMILLNVRLMIFNLIPIPPLDGSRVLYALLPDRVDIAKLETYGPIILLGLIFLGGNLLFSILDPLTIGLLSILNISSL